MATILDGIVTFTDGAQSGPERLPGGAIVTASSYRRIRRCFGCGVALPAGRFVSIDLGARWGWDDMARRRCPEVRHGRTDAGQFWLVREVHRSTSVIETVAASTSRAVRSVADAIAEVLAGVHRLAAQISLWEAST